MTKQLIAESWSEIVVLSSFFPVDDYLLIRARSSCILALEVPFSAQITETNTCWMPGRTSGGKRETTLPGGESMNLFRNKKKISSA